MNDHQPWQFICKTCGGRDLTVTHVWNILAGPESETWQEWGPLQANHLWRYEFKEKVEKQASFINGGFFVVNKKIGNYLTDDTCVFEQEPLNRLASEEQIVAYLHGGFWQCMDTYREQQLLTAMWNSGKAPWKVW